VEGLTNNRTYKFKVRAENVYGLGPYSTISAIRPTGIPEGLNPIATNLVGTNILIQWQAFESKGRTITSYEILFLQSDGITWTEIPLFCNGHDSSVVEKHFCYVPMLVFRLKPFYLKQDDLIQGKVRAYNIKGWSSYTNPNTVGQTILTEPHQMSTPNR